MTVLAFFLLYVAYVCGMAGMLGATYHSVIKPRDHDGLGRFASITIFLVVTGLIIPLCIIYVVINPKEKP